MRLVHIARDAAGRRSAAPNDDPGTPTRRLRHRARWAWLIAAVAVLVYVVLSLARNEPFHPGAREGFFDLKVYRAAARLLLNGGPIYGRAVHSWAPFTYPPFAAIVMAPLALMPITADEIIVTVIGAAALATTLWLAVGLAESSIGIERRGGRRVVWPVAVAFAATLWLEPVTTALAFGQIELVLSVLIIADLSLARTCGRQGAMIGLAAGLKLTPLIFVVYLAFSRRPRAALVAVGTFAATVAVSFAVTPDGAGRYWSGLVFNSQLAGVGATPANQSLRGAILGLAPAASSTPITILCLAVGAAGVALAALASRSDDEATGFSLCAVTGLLVSPISWTHHWVLGVPALSIVAVKAGHRRSLSRLLAAGAVALVGYAYLPEVMANLYPHNHLVPPLWQPASTCYLLIGLATLALAGAREMGAARRSRAKVAIAPNTSVPSDHVPSAVNSARTFSKLS